MVRTIAMVSNKEGQNSRKEADARAATLLATLSGAKVVDAEFSNTWLNIRAMKSLVLEKDGKKFRVSVESEASWEGSTSDWMEVKDLQTGEVLSEEDV